MRMSRPIARSATSRKRFQNAASSDIAIVMRMLLARFSRRLVKAQSTNALIVEATGAAMSSVVVGKIAESAVAFALPRIIDPDPLEGDVEVPLRQRPDAQLIAFDPRAALIHQPRHIGVQLLDHDVHSLIGETLQIAA